MSQAMRKRVLCHNANNKGADQPAHPRSLISAFVARSLDSVMSLVSVTKISSLMLASVAEQASLSLTWSETPEDTFSQYEAHIVAVNETPIDSTNQISASQMIHAIKIVQRIVDFLKHMYMYVDITINGNMIRTYNMRGFCRHHN